MKMHFALTVISQSTKQLLGVYSPSQSQLEWAMLETFVVNKRFPR